jgi:TatD DNase family protein
MFVDSHAHIYHENFKKETENVISRAADAGVRKIYMPNVSVESIDEMLEMENKFPDTCIPMIGLHPCDVSKDFEKQLYVMEDWLSKREFAGIGEMGLDFHWDLTYKEQQIEAFKIQTEWAKKHKLPVILHTRNGTREAIDLIKELKDESLTGIFHCFGGTVEEAKEIIDLGFLLGIGGVVTFKNGGLEKVLPELSLENLVLETDCPYLAPVPYRGKRNEPSYIPLIAQKVADVMRKDIGEVAQVTTENCEKIFKI